jgi:ABC-2 type transport system ATP-binding protein
LAVQALADVDFRVGWREALAVLGPNGSGKSTLLRCVGGLLMPTRGQVTVAGRSVHPPCPALYHDVTYVAGDARSCSWRLNGRAHLFFFATRYGLTGSAARDRVEHALERVALTAAQADQQVSRYSTGMRQRLALARGFLASPRVWLLDEPTVGVDARSSRELVAYIRTELVEAQGAAVLMATHSIDHAREIARRAILLEAGRVAFAGDVDAAADRMLA